MRRNVSLLLTVTMLVSVMASLLGGFLGSAPPVVAASAQSGGRRNALDALGIDTSVLPDGYDPHSTSTPYGRDSVTINPVYELFVSTYEEDPSSQLNIALHGHNQPLTDFSMADFYAQAQIATVQTPPMMAATASAAGNFIRGVTGKTGQVATVGMGELSHKGGLYLYFTDPVSGTMSSSQKVLLAPTKTIGNYGQRMNEDFEESPYLAQNYLQIAAGDFTGDGVDEVAIYVAEQNHSRVEIYKLHLRAEDNRELDWLIPERWVKIWTHYFNESPFVSNMVSVTAGDFNRNGIDDLALTWGYYYGPTEFRQSEAVILYGANLNPFHTRKTIELIFNTHPIVRAAFTLGDISGDREPELILGGQLHTDIAAGNLNTRFAAVYTYDGLNDRFLPVVAENFDLFEKDEDGNYVHAVMERSGSQKDTYFSVPAMQTNMAAAYLQGIGHAAHVYLDGLLIQYTEHGLEVDFAMDNQASFNHNINHEYQRYYMEYGAIAADFNGDSKETVQIMQHYDTLTVQPTYNPSAWEIWWWVLLYGGLPPDPDPVTYPRDLSLVSMYYEDDTLKSWRSGQLAFNTSFCKANTDEDTMLLEYTGIRYLTYSNPEVLAILASPPHFADLDNDELSGSYMDSETSWRSATGEGESTLWSYAIRVGAYAGFQHDFTAPVTGTKVGSLHMELSVTKQWTWEYARTRSVEQSVSYSTPAGQDAVAFFSLPIETYVYRSLVPVFDETGERVDWDEQLMSVNIPHVAAVRVLPLDHYERIAADYEELPKIAGNILTHTVGDPSTYPTSVAGLKNVEQADGYPAAVGFGGGSITQAIEISTADEDVFSHNVAIDLKVGGGPGSLVFGVTVGGDMGWGSATITTAGSTLSGTIHNMPIEAEPYGYAYAWKPFMYYAVDYLELDGWKLRHVQEMPVVNYQVFGVVAPPQLPTDFRQNVADTTHDQIALTWSYRGPAAGFRLLRYYEFPDGAGSYELAIIPASDGIAREDGEGNRFFEYHYIDTGLYPYTDYSYQIQVIGAAQPAESIPSQVYRFRTKTDVGYPTLSLGGLTEGRLLVYPDTDHKVSVTIHNPGDYAQPAKYQWQRLTAAGWRNIEGATRDEFIFRDSGQAVVGEYRCRVNVIYGAYFISSFTETFHVDYSMRQSQFVTGSFQVKDDSGATPNVPKIEVSLRSRHTNHFLTPSGTVVFSVSGSDYQQDFFVSLIPADAGVAKATLALDRPLPEGVYEITAFYQGDGYFGSLSTFGCTHVPEVIPYLAGTGSGYALTLNSSYVYGRSMLPALRRVEKEDGSTSFTDVMGDVSYVVVEEVWVPVYYHWWWFVWLRWERQLEIVDGFVNGDTLTARRAGQFTLQAYVNNDLVASKDFNVTPKPITITATDQTRVAGDPTLIHPDDQILTVHPISLPYGDAIADLGLEIQVTNTAGTEVTIRGNCEHEDCPDCPAPTDPGAYVTIARPAVASSVRNNYDITYVPGTYILTGPLFTVRSSVPLLNDKVVGAMELISPHRIVAPGWEKDYPDGANLVFLAKPNQGYDVKGWTINNEPRGAASTLYHTMYAEDIDVVVEFQVAQRQLHFLVRGGRTPTCVPGKVECTSNPFMQSGDVAMLGAEFTFLATPFEGYHFKEWQLEDLSQGITTKPAGTEGPDGTNTCTISMGVGEIRLYAVFERYSYQVTLGNNLQARFWADADVGHEEIITYSGSWIMGDTEVVIEPKPGFFIPDHAVWTQNGTEVTAGVSGDNQAYTFIMEADTSISVQTEIGYFDIDLIIAGPGAAENTVAVTVNDVAADGAELTDIAGGSTLKFTAQPAYGYLFDQWIINGDEDNPVATISYSINALGDDQEIRAVFKDNDAYTVTVSHNVRGSLAYALNQGPATSLPADGVIPVFGGDQVVITATPEAGFMVEQWWVNGDLHQTTVKSKTFALPGDLAPDSNDLDVQVIFGAQTYSTVTYSAGDNGSISATSDGHSFPSGDVSVGNGTKVEFTALPDAGYMVDKWSMDNELVLNEWGQPLRDTMFVIPALSGSIDVEVTFKEIVTHLVEVFDTNTTTEVVIVPVSSAVAPDEVLEGAKVVFTVRPDENHAVRSVSVTGNAGVPDLSGFDSIIQEADGSWVCVVNAVTSNLVVMAQADPLYSISIGDMPLGGSITLGAEWALPGEKVTLRATAASQYRFDRWHVEDTSGMEVSVDNATAANTHFVMPTNDVLVTADFTFVPSPGPVPPLPPLPPPTDRVTVTLSEDQTTQTLSITAEAILGETGRYLATIEDDLMEELMELARIFRAEGYQVVIEVIVDALSDAQAVDVNISEESFAAMLELENVVLKLDTGVANVTFNSEALSAMVKEGGDLSIATERVDARTLSPEAQATVGDCPVYRFGVTTKDTPILDFGDGMATVRIPYTLQPGEEENAVVVYYVDDHGKVKTIWGQYEAATQTVVFRTSHFSVFVVDYNEVNFVDVATDAWYMEAVGYLAARGMVQGVGEDRFAPARDVIRADFLIMVMNAYGIEVNPQVEENFADAGNRYYTAYLATARAMGLVEGVGDNLYLPEANISRQDMFVILYRILHHLDQRPEAYGEKALEDFYDASDIADYAFEAMKHWVEADIVRGDGTVLTPMATATRAQAAQVLYNLISRY